MGILGGILGNYSEVSIQDLTNQYGPYLMPQEKIEMGFRLVRDTFIITDDRLLLIDHQGVTGKKTRVASIHLNSIYEVTMESAGTGLDDSEITIHYITSPYYKANSIQTATYRFEFGKKFNVQPFYVALITLAHQNNKRINS
ncbi:PH domain-containing protein [Paenibacillus sp. ACRRX]|uniref:PH domain-containing protein n=1 Tax=unclassified Paenibacillus TaxID=185978 RepID=UPI001EF4FA52|nr:PH domain-containing protein [Paenibacillus sp. UMB4589-SE434]MCG7405892.1 PH domain-containing protein [Paenibacillus sp. ACRRX]MDK8182343.1 PH domain-containing protein [Paenibacillus sp. UMB4589-SE434]